MPEVTEKVKTTKSETAADTRKAPGLHIPPPFYQARRVSL